MPPSLPGHYAAHRSECDACGGGLGVPRRRWDIGDVTPEGGEDGGEATAGIDWDVDLTAAGDDSADGGINWDIDITDVGTAGGGGDTVEINWDISTETPAAGGADSADTPGIRVRSLFSALGPCTALRPCTEGPGRGLVFPPSRADGWATDARRRDYG